MCIYFVFLNYNLIFKWTNPLRNLLLLLFVTSIFQVNAQSYKIEQEIDVNGALDITNMNSVYNQMGVHYVGNGYYASTSSNTGYGTKNSGR